MADNKPRRQATKVPRKQAIPEELGYVAFHSTNLGLCLASGFLGVRHEPSAARNPHESEGLIVVSKTPVPASVLGAAKGTIRYGQVILVELDLWKMALHVAENGEFLPIPAPIPLAMVRRIVFRAENDRIEFLARIAGYADVPEDLIDCAVDSGLFDASELESVINIHSTLSEVSLPVIACTKKLDKLAGAIAAALYVTRSSQPEYHFTDVFIKACTIEGSGDKTEGFTVNIANAVDPEATNHSLIAAATRLLESLDPNGGIDSEAFLDSLTQPDLWGAAPVDSAALSFRQHAGDVIASRRELSEDAFADCPGKIVPRALLLFLLNPDAGRLWAVPKKIKKLGQKVYMLALVLSGCFTGLTNLPSSLKAPTKSAFLGVALLSSRVWNCEPVIFDQLVYWGLDGTRHHSIRIGELELFSTESPPLGIMVKAHEAAVKLGLHPSYEESTGEICFNTDFLHGLWKASIFPGVAPTMPKLDALELRFVSTFTLGAKEIVKSVGDVNRTAKDTGIFAIVEEHGKLRHLQLTMFCPVHTFSKDVLASSMFTFATEAKFFSPQATQENSLSPEEGQAHISKNT